MSKEDLHKVQKEWETNNWQRGLSLICRIQCTKDPTVIARTVEILEKCGCATDERVKELRKFEGGRFCRVCICVCVCFLQGTFPV